MGINVRPEEKWGTGKKLIAWVFIGMLVVLFGLGYGKVMDDTSFKYCAGDYNTEQCRKDRELRNHITYERKKAER